MAENEGHGSNPAHPAVRGARESARVRSSESAAIGTAWTEAKRSGRRTDGANGLRTVPEQKVVTDQLKRASESEKNAHLKRQLEHIERRKRELNLPTERRALIQSDNTEHNTERTREQMAKARLTANEIAGMKNAEFRAKQREAVREKAYTGYREEVFKGTLEKGDVKKIKIDGKDLIIPKDAPQNPDSPEFWNHHANTKETYDKFARQYPEIQKRLAEGKTIGEIGKDPELKGAAGFWYSKQDVVANDYKSHLFVENGYHRAKLAKEHNLEGVPVSVYEWNEKENK